MPTTVQHAPHRPAGAAAQEAPSYEPAPWSGVAQRRSYRWWVVGTVCIGAFMGQLDASIAQLVLPTLATVYHEPLRTVSWVSLAYLLALASTLPIFGRLADMFGRKLLYTGGFVIFIAGSALCGFAPTLGLLIVARVFQAIGAGLLQANSVAIITAAAGPGLRGRAIGIQGAAQAVGLSTGPALGGLLIQSLGWRWVFWINVPAGLLGAVLGLLVLPRTIRVQRDRRFDWWGAVLLAPALTAILLVVSEARIWGYASALTLGVLAAGLATLALFVARERSASAPLVDLSLFRIPAFSLGNVAGLLSYAILFAAFFLLPFALERGRGDSPLAAGLMLTAIPVALGLVAPLSGALSDHIGARWLTVTGMLLTAGALVLLALDQGMADLPLLLAGLALLGVGQGLFTAPNNSAIMGAAPSVRLGVAGGMLNLTRSIGTATGVAAATALLSWRLAAHALHPESSALAPPPLLMAAVHDTLLAFALLALVAAIVSLLRGAPLNRARKARV